ncbi:MAG TPA: hypothetical protein VLK23_11375 [Thermodesulfobacteriota bacterium]|nr:hypothetical protein [Thermodesulfobacteriota bacterium]
MVKWEYQITIHELPGLQVGGQEKGIECDQTGQCFVPYDAVSGGVGWLESLFRERGREGWELVQSGYHQRELFCIWKKMVEAGQKG